ncbi:MAG: response regulator [Candidatus Solibacter sp.]
MPCILVADDDAVQLDLRKQLLEIAGYRVEVAFTANQTVRRLENALPDLVIVDLRLANAEGESDAREGLALIRRIRQTSARLPMIVLSGWPDDLYGQPEEQLVSRVLVKPVRTRELLHAIRDLIT